jgi:hypothetical protein
MPSTILTKVNTVTPRNFAQSIEWRTGHSDKRFLKSFVDLCHKKADTIEVDYTITAFTKKGSYTYTAYLNYIMRNDNNTSKKKFYKIS